MKSKGPQGRDRKPHKGPGKPRTEKSSFGGKSSFGKPSFGKPRGENPRGENPRGQNQRGENARGENPRAGKPYEGKSYGGKPRGGKPHFGKSGGSRPQNDHSRDQQRESPRDQQRDHRPQRTEYTKPHSSKPPKPERENRSEYNNSTTEVWLYGHHPVAAALANQERRVLRLLATPEAMERLREDASVPQGVLTRAHNVSRKEIDNIVGENAVHQGVAMFTRVIDHHLEDVLEIAKERESCCVVLLDQVSDPHNVGAILRSAAAFDASAVITLDRRAAAETGALAKSASGALDRISFVQTTNLSRAIEVLQQNQFWVIGLEADGEKKLSEIDLKGRIAFVMGTEGEGLRRLVRENCDQVVRLPINAASESLNVSNAAAIALYERVRQIG